MYVHCFLLILIGVFIWIFYNKKPKQIYQVLTTVFNKSKYKQKINYNKKYVFGAYVNDVAQTMTFMISTNCEVPIIEINKLFVNSNVTMQGTSAICYIVMNDNETIHSWKLYADSAHTHILGSLAKEITNQYML